MSELRKRLDELESEERRLQERRTEIIAGAARTFEHLEESTRYGRERYRIVMADGSSLGYAASYSQRPTAERRFRYMAQQYGGNVYFFDKRENRIFDIDGNEIARPS